MRECRIVLPSEDNFGNEFVELHTEFVEEIVRAYNNCRASSAVSFFRNMKTQKFDDVDVLVYDFTVDETQVTCEKIKELAIKYAKKCGIEYVYVVTPLGFADHIHI